jgi:pyruvyltransferase
MRTVATHWSRCAGGRNFGDVFTPFVFRELAGVDLRWTAPEDARLFGAGSIIVKIPAGFDGIVFTTGTQRPGRYRLPHATVLAVRGARTARALGLGRVPLGDLGLLAADLARTTPGTNVGLVPHYADPDLVHRHRCGTVISILNDPQHVIDQIGSCDRIISSSLHALIVADALGIPHMFEPHPAVVGGTWKFDDYASAFGFEQFPIGVWRSTPRDIVVERQAQLRHLAVEVIDALA